MPTYTIESDDKNPHLWYLKNSEETHMVAYGTFLDMTNKLRHLPEARADGRVRFDVHLRRTHPAVAVMTVRAKPGATEEAVRLAQHRLEEDGWHSVIWHKEDLGGDLRCDVISIQEYDAAGQPLTEA